jgi:hypothetical protein
MKENFNYKLIDGVFNPSEAQQIMMDLINTKINYHSLDSFSNHIRFNTEITSSKIRIDELNETAESIKNLIELAEQNNMQLKLNSDISIEFIKKQ